MPVKKELAKIKKPELKEETPVEVAVEESPEAYKPKAKRGCYFCESKTEPSYTDSVTLRKYLSDRSKIIAKSRTGACSKHQRRISREIKHARHLAILPFLTRV